MHNLFSFFLCFLFFVNPLFGIGSKPSKVDAGRKSYLFKVEQMQINSKSSIIVSNINGNEVYGVSLLEGKVNSLVEKREADITIDISNILPDRYVISSVTYTNPIGYKLMTQAKTKYESIFASMELDGQHKTKRVVFVPWHVEKQPSNQVLGKFVISEKNKSLRIWLPEGVILQSIQLKPYYPPVIPENVNNYIPSIVPPKSHPRLWVNKESLTLVKGRLNQGENLAVWEKVKVEAKKTFNYKLAEEGQEISFDYKFEKQVESKAFFYMMTGDRVIGMEAVQYMRNYLSHIEFGNLLDITREIGRTIYIASLVYDWCFDLLSEEDKKIYVSHLMRLADDMEIGWPPFLQSVVNGHGNEAQVCRDLLAMSIAIYDEYSEPYKFTSYHILEQLVPLRKFEYQSPRHNQGVNYGSYRFGWDMHAAWIYYRMSGKTVFDNNIKDVPQFWLYARLPDGEMLRDGDGFGSTPPGQSFYWKAPITSFLSYTYNSDPYVKGDFERQGGLNNENVLYLLLNDPELTSIKTRESLPLTIDFGKVLGGMIARTGWNMGKSSNDVVAEIKGGGYHFGNHQHSDAGSIQLYYRGLQFGDLGVYKFYGTPYDFNFNKRSISHSMMLALDPNEKFLKTESNDGGTKFNQRFPKSIDEVQNDNWFANGDVISTSFGPSAHHPYFSYFSVDLTSAYNSKLEKYVRDFCFINLNRKDIPAMIILSDKMKTKLPTIKKYWQINSINAPFVTSNEISFSNQKGDLIGNTYINTLLPKSENREVMIMSGDMTHNSFGKQYIVPSFNYKMQEMSGYRVMLSLKNEQVEDEFLNVFQVTADNTKPMPVQHFKTNVSHVIIVDDNVISVNKLDYLIDQEFVINIPNKKLNNVLLTGLKEGSWQIISKKFSDNEKSYKVEAEKNTLFFEATKGDYIIRKIN